jgi:RecA-family ATPase
MPIRTLNEFLALEKPKVSFWVNPYLLPYSGSMFLYGKAETLKSWLALELAFAVSKGDPWLSRYPTEETRVLIFQTEETEHLYQRRVEKAAAHMNGSKPRSVYGENLFLNSEPGAQLDQFTGFSQLEKDIKERGIRVVIFDNLYRSITSSTKDEVGVARFLDNLDRMRHQYGVAFVIVHHSRKAGDDVDEGDFEEMTGSARLGYWADTIIRSSVRTRTPNGRPEAIQVILQKVRQAEEDVDGMQVRLNREIGRLVWP